MPNPQLQYKGMWHPEWKLILSPQKRFSKTSFFFKFLVWCNRDSDPLVHIAGTSSIPLGHL